MPSGLTTRHRLCVVLALSLVVGLVCAGLNTGRLGLLPPTVKRSTLQRGGAQARFLVDVPGRSLAQRRALPPDLPTLVKRTELVGRLMVADPVLARIARASGVPADRLGGTARVTASVPEAMTQPESEERASDIATVRLPYRLEVQADPEMPVLAVYAQAPSAQTAARLANAAGPALMAYVRSRPVRRRPAATAVAAAPAVTGPELGPVPVRLVQLGEAQGLVLNRSAPLVVGALTFLVSFALCALAAGGALWLRDRRTGASHLVASADRRPEPADGGDWPHTARVVPWLLAAFIAMAWVLPFNAVQLNVSAPIDLKLDRLLLPFVVGLWILAVALGGRSAPRLRLTWMHGALGAFVACAFLSVVLEARALNQSLELDLAFKQLPLLLSYAAVFVVVASTVRRSEVRAFLIYSLVLAVVVALGMIWEYRFRTNVFFAATNAVLPGVFSVQSVDPTAVDGIGRRLVRGPADAPLEAVTMLAMALPIALVLLMQAKRWWPRLLYAAAACLLIAATFATFRKSGLLAPVAAVATLAYFRRRELLRLAPLGLVLVVVVSALSPGALRATVMQFIRPDRAAVPTVSDRTADYDAIRPDVWSHIAFGRGWGTYNHVDYRILDSELLHRLIEIGVVGLAAFLLVGISVVLCARRTIAARDPASAPYALVGAAVAVVFLTSTALYDILSFPHGVYIFMYVAGLVAVVTARPSAARAEPQPALAADERGLQELERAPVEPERVLAGRG